MATTEAPPCRRCHGSGHEPPRPTYTEQQEVLLTRLEELGAERARLYRTRAYMTSSGRPGYDAVVAEIRKELEGDLAATIRVSDLAQALGVTGTAYYKILNGETGT